jgi:hypothetical protein
MTEQFDFVALYIRGGVSLTLTLHIEPIITTCHLLCFVGFNNQLQTVVFAHALIRDECTDTFE